MAERSVITNATGENIVTVTDFVPNSKGLAFIQHGLGGDMKQPHIQTIARALRDAGYVTVRFDTRHSFGESHGTYERATVTSGHEDLQTVVLWAETQRWFQEPFILAGHSLGGLCTALYAEQHPERVLGLAPLSTLVSGTLSMGLNKEAIREWKRTGWRIRESSTHPGRVKKLPWSHMEDRLQYDLLSRTNALTMPVLFIVGSDDRSTPPEHQQMLFDALPGAKKELHVISNAPHTFRDTAHLDQVRRIVHEWAGKLAPV